MAEANALLRWHDFHQVRFDFVGIRVVGKSQALGNAHDMGISLVVRIIGEKVIVEHDTNNKPAADALIQAGISRKNIVLAYVEAIPEAAS